MQNNKLLKIYSFIVMVSICLSLFGTFMKIKAIKEEISNLQGRIIFIDCGHGGKDNGASVDDVLEDSINMKIGGYLFEKLVEAGAYVLMSRTSDYDLSSMYQKNRKREDLNNRVKYINDSKPDLFISIHLNTYPKEYVKGPQVFYQNNEKSKNLANSIQKEMNILTYGNRAIKLGDYFILNKSKYVGALIECGFLSNGEERKKLNTNDYQNKIAERIKKGVVKYFSYY